MVSIRGKKFTYNLVFYNNRIRQNSSFAASVQPAIQV